MSSTLTLHPQRVRRLFETLKATAPQDATAASIPTYVAVVGNLEEMAENQRSVALFQHIFNSPSPIADIAMAIQPTGALVLVTPRDVALIDTNGVDNVTVLQAPANGEVKESSFLDMITGEFPVGVAKRELKIQNGAFAVGFVKMLDSLVAESTRQKDVAPFLGSLLFVKDQECLDCISKASGLCVATLKRFARPYLEEALSSGRPPQLDSFEGMICHKLEHPNEIEGMESIQFEHFSPSLRQRVMCMENYSSALQSTDVSTQLLQPDIVTIRFGARHRGESALIGRSFIIEKNAPAEASAAYSFLTEVHKTVQAELKVDTKLTDVYNTVMKIAQEKNATFAPFLMKNFGYATGLLVLENRSTIGEKATISVQPNMTFVIRSVLEDVPSASSGKKFSLEISDTIVVTADGAVEIKTKFGRELDDIKYTEQVDDQQENEEEQFTRDLRSITRRGKNAVPLISREEERDEKRRKLLAKLHAEFMSSGGRNRTEEDLDVVRAQTLGQLVTGDLQPYPQNFTRPDLGSNMLKVVREKRVAWIPICGVATPFHVSTINRVDLKKEGNQAVLTIVFHSLQETSVAFRMNRTSVFVKDVTYTAPKEDVFHDFVRNVNECIRDIKAADLENKNNQGLARGGGLRITPNPRKLPNIKIRPAPVTGKHGVSGNLEIHENGLRFSNIHSAPVEIMYSNVKHFIFQPAKNTISTIFHVTLKQPILVGKKKTDEISFYADVLEASESVEGTRKTSEQEIEEEEREQLRVDATNREFAIFAKDVHQKSGRNVELPMESFQVDGVPHRALTGIRASTRVIWALDDLPPFTLSVSEIEVVSLERVRDSGVNFDINFIPKSYKAAIPITTVPRSCLEVVKEWALQSGLYYIESDININWAMTFKKIRDDPTWEPFGKYGWIALTDDFEDEEEEDEEGDDSDSDPSYDSEEDEEDDEEEDSDSDFSFASDSSVSTASEDSDESSEASWGAMERKASRHDRERNLSDSDDDDDRPKRKVARSEVKAPPPKQSSKIPAASAPYKAPGKFVGKGPVPAAPGKITLRPAGAPPLLPRR